MPETNKWCFTFWPSALALWSWRMLSWPWYIPAEVRDKHAPFKILGQKKSRFIPLLRQEPQSCPVTNVTGTQCPINILKFNSQNKSLFASYSVQITHTNFFLTGINNSTFHPGFQVWNGESTLNFTLPILCSVISPVVLTANITFLPYIFKALNIHIQTTLIYHQTTAHTHKTL